MPAQNYDIITVGGGIAASALAKALAEQGARILVLERETKFKDRVRGEGLVCWGGGEARELGIYELLKKPAATTFRLSSPAWGREISRQQPHNAYRFFPSSIKSCRKRCWRTRNRRGQRFVAA